MAVLQANLSRGSARSMTTQAVKHDARLDSDAPDSLSRRTPYISHLDSNTASLVLSLLPAHLPFLPSHLQDGKILLVPPKPQNILPHFLLLLLTSPSQPNLDASPLVYTLSLSQAGHLSNLLGSTRTLRSPPDSPISSPVPRRARCTAGQAVLGKGVEPRQERSQSDPGFKNATWDVPWGGAVKDGTLPASPLKGTAAPNQECTSGVVQDPQVTRVN